MPALTLEAVALPEDEEEEAADLGMMEVLRRLKKAETQQTAEKKRKHNQGLLDALLAEFEAESREEVEKLRRKSKRTTSAVSGWKGSPPLCEASSRQPRPSRL